MKTKSVNVKLLAKLLANLPQVPDGKSGKMSVSHRTVKAGEPVVVVSWRNGLFMGQQPTKFRFSHPITIRSLVEKDRGVWMTDQPQEIWQMRDAVSKARGNVLIGGLGLGAISHLIPTMGTNVDSVTTVERSQDIANIVAPYIAKQTLIVADLFEYLKNTDRKFDFAFFDIWQGTGETDWAEYIVPIRRLCRRKIPQRSVLCWNENEMKGQLLGSLLRNAHLDRPAWYCHEPLRLVAQSRGITKPVDFRDIEPIQFFEIGRNNGRLLHLVKAYLSPGTDRWERLFGDSWDAITENKHENRKATV